MVCLNTDFCHSAPDKADLSGCSRRNIYDSSVLERAPVVDAYHNSFPVFKIDNSDAGTERKGAVCGCEVAAAEIFAIGCFSSAEPGGVV